MKINEHHVRLVAELWQTYKAVGIVAKGDVLVDLPLYFEFKEEWLFSSRWSHMQQVIKIA